MNFGIALKEKPGDSGLDKNDIVFLYGLIANPFSNSTDEVYLIELEAKEHECSAMGFITVEAANLLDYDYESSGLHDFIASILDDMEKESADGRYNYKGSQLLGNKLPSLQLSCSTYMTPTSYRCDFRDVASWAG